MDLPAGYDDWKLGCPEEKLGCPEDEGYWEPYCTQCKREKEDESQDELCPSCMEENWLDTHGYEFPGGFGAGALDSVLSGQDSWDTPSE